MVDEEAGEAVAGAESDGRHDGVEAVQMFHCHFSIFVPGQHTHSHIVMLKELVGQIVKGDRKSLSKAITLVESTREEDKRLSRQLLRLLPTPTKPSIRLGFTGSPGSGKSSLLESLGVYLLNNGKVGKMAVLAIDPSSSKSGGSIMGDKTRMTRLAADPRAYIRPSPARGSLGGITLGTANAARLCQAAHHDLVVVETVGVGQSETAIAALSDVTVLVVAPNAGDDLQGIKKGVTECADIIVVNKCDLVGAEAALSFYKNAVQLQDMNAGRRRMVQYSVIMVGVAGERKD